MVMRMKEKIAIIGPVDETGKQTLYNKLSDEFDVIEVKDRNDYYLLHDVVAVVLRTLTLTESDFEAMKALRAIQRWGAGYDTVDIQAAAERGIPVMVASGLNSIPVAEYTVLLMLSVYRNLISINQNVRAGKWRDDNLIARSYVLNKKTVGLVGLGNIGKRVAKIVQAFGAQVVYYDAYPMEKEEDEKLGVKQMPLDELLKNADVVSVHVPLMEETHHLLDMSAFRKMKKTAIIINTARGGIVDEDALYNALKEEEILGAGMDVFEQEPPSVKSRLFQLENVVVSSHSAGNTGDNSSFMAERCADNLWTVLSGGKISKPDLVNGDLLRKYKEEYNVQ